MTPTLLLVDGTKILMRCAFGGQVPAPEAIETAARMITRAGMAVRATHQVVAFDVGASWRKQVDPDYKLHRSSDTEKYVAAARIRYGQLGWYMVTAPGFEADDIIATLAARLVDANLVVLSSDSDLLALIRPGLAVLRPGSGSFQRWGETEVQERYGLSPLQLPDFKALCGEKGDHIQGVPLIGEKRATELLQEYGTLDAILADTNPEASKEALRVRSPEGRAAALHARRLVTLRTDVPIHPIKRHACAIRRGVAA